MVVDPTAANVGFGEEAGPRLAAVITSVGVGVVAETTNPASTDGELCPSRLRHGRIVGVELGRRAGRARPGPPPRRHRDRHVRSGSVCHRSGAAPG